MNTMKKRSIMIRVMAVLSVVMMFTICFVGGTFAKYTSSGSNSDSATVAKWSFKVGETDIATSNSFTFDLFKTIQDSNGTDNETDINPTDGTIIAPGTQGSFELVLKNVSQVNATYAIDYTVTNTNHIPVKFSVDGGAHWTDDLADVPATQIAHTNGIATITVQWKWVYETYKAVDTNHVRTPVPGVAYYTLSGNDYVHAENLNSFVDGTTYYTLEDAADTTFGADGTAQITVAAKVTATQVD